MDRIAFLVVVAASCVAGCRGDGARVSEPESVGIGPVLEDAVTLPSGNATSAALDLRFVLADFQLDPGSGPQLLAGSCRTNLDCLRPFLSHSFAGGELSARLEKRGDLPSTWFGNEGVVNLCRLQLGARLPTTLQLTSEACNGFVELGGIPLTLVEVRGNESNLDIAFDEANSEILNEFDIIFGIGKLRVQRLGNANFAQMQVQGGIGQIELDFSGDWQQSARVAISGGLSTVDIFVPRQIAVCVNRSDETMECELPGFEPHPLGLVNEAWNEERVGDRVELWIELQSGFREFSVKEI